MEVRFSLMATMLIISTLSILISNAVAIRRDMAILFNRVAIISLFYCLLQSFLCFSILSGGIGLHGGLFHITAITQIFHIFLFLISILILQLTSFYPRKVLLPKHSSLKDVFFSKLVYYNTNIINKMGEHLKIIEYPRQSLIIRNKPWVLNASLIANSSISYKLKGSLNNLNIYINKRFYSQALLLTPLCFL